MASQIAAWGKPENDVGVRVMPVWKHHGIVSDSTWRGGGPRSALRAYRAYHPMTRVHIVEYRGRTVWMTDKQFNLWCYIRAMQNRNQKLTLVQIAKRIRYSRASISKFLHRLDFWRFVDLVTLRGRGGGIFILRAKRPRLGYGETRAERTLRHSRLAKQYRIVEKFWRRFSLLPDMTDIGYTGETFRFART